MSNRRSAFPGYEVKETNVNNERVQPSNTSNTHSNCVICGADNHIQTNRPHGIKLVQYFACKTFVDMFPNQRLQYLKSNGLCINVCFRVLDLIKGNIKKDLTSSADIHHTTNSQQRNTFLCVKNTKIINKIKTFSSITKQDAL